MIPEELTRFRENPMMLQSRLDWAIELEKTTPERLFLNHFKRWEPRGTEAIVSASLQDIEQLNQIPEQYNSYKSLQKNSIILAIISFVLLLIASMFHARTLGIALLVGIAIFVAGSIYFRIRRISVGSVHIGGKRVTRESKMIQLAGFFHLSQYKIITNINRSELIVCPTCKGEGSYESFCTSCRGSGSLKYTVHDEWNGDVEMSSQCSDCGGTGRKIYSCSLCGGKGNFGTAGEWADRYNSAASKINIQLDEITSRNKEKVAEFNRLVETNDEKIRAWNSKLIKETTLSANLQKINDPIVNKPQDVEATILICPFCRGSIESSVLLANHLKCPECGKHVVDCNYHTTKAVAHCSQCGIYLCEKCIYTRNERNYCNKCNSEVDM